MEPGREGSLAEDRVVFIWRGDLSWFISLNCISHFRLHYSNSNLIDIKEAGSAAEPPWSCQVWHVSVGNERKSNSKFSQTLSTKLYFGPSFVINYSILLWHICLDKLNVKLSDFKTKQMYKFCGCFFSFFKQRPLVFFCASREMDGISFSSQMTRVPSGALIKFEVSVQVLIPTLLLLAWPTWLDEEVLHWRKGGPSPPLYLHMKDGCRGQGFSFFLSVEVGCWGKFGLVLTTNLE